MESERKGESGEREMGQLRVTSIINDGWMHLRKRPSLDAPLKDPIASFRGGLE